MAVSQNGYPACDRGVLHNPTVPGTSIDFPGGLRRGPAGDLLIWIAEQLHRRVENGGTGYGMWGYACRDIRASEADFDTEASLIEATTGDKSDYADDDPDELGPNLPCAHIAEDDVYTAAAVSNHASGTAIDWHAPRHPLGKRNTYNAAQQAEIHRIEAQTQGCARWGGDWSRPDDMHWEIVKGEAECARVLTILRGGAAPPPGGTLPAPTPDDEMLSLGDRGPAVEVLQRVLNAWFPQAKLTVDGIFGPDTDRWVRTVQRNAGITVDGWVGEETRRVLGLKPPSAYDEPPPPPAKPAVGGEIGYVYHNTPGLAERLGPPTTPELPTPDGIGRYNHFEQAHGGGGSIYWTPANGAFAVVGAIRAKWAELGWERSPLGYPISNEFDASCPVAPDRGPSQWRQSNFENGVIMWTPEAGAYARY